MISKTRNPGKGKNVPVVIEGDEPERLTFPVEDEIPSRAGARPEGTCPRLSCGFHEVLGQGGSPAGQSEGRAGPAVQGHPEARPEARGHYNPG